MEETKEQIINLIKKQDYGNVIDLFEEIDETTIQEIIQNISENEIQAIFGGCSDNIKEKIINAVHNIDLKENLIEHLNPIIKYKYIQNNRRELQEEFINNTIKELLSSDLDDLKKKILFEDKIIPNANGIELHQILGKKFVRENIESIIKLEFGEDTLSQKLKLITQIEEYVGDNIYLNMNFEILENNYINAIGIEGIVNIALNNEKQNKLLKLDGTRLEILSRCLENKDIINDLDGYEIVLNQTLESISAETFNGLINDIDNIADLTDSDVKIFQQIIQNNNIFEINSLNDLRNYENIKSQKCDDWIKSDSIDKKRLAVFEKIFGQESDFLNRLQMRFSDVEEIENKNISQYIKCIREILQIENPRVLEEFYNICSQQLEIDDVLIEQEIKKEYGNLFNKGLLKIEQCEEIGENIYEAGTEFKMIVHRRQGSPVNYFEDWNREKSNSNNYICASYIRNDMIATYEAGKVLYGFNDLAPKSICGNSIEDAGTGNAMQNLTTPNNLINSVQIHNTGENEQCYNELNYKRFNNGQRQKPSYIVVFRINGEIDKSIFNEAKKAQEQWNNELPIVIIDVNKCIEAERQKVEEMRKEYEQTKSPVLAREIYHKIRNNQATIAHHKGKIKTSFYEEEMQQYIVSDEEIEKYNQEHQQENTGKKKSKIDIIYDELITIKEQNKEKEQTNEEFEITPKDIAKLDQDRKITATEVKQNILKRLLDKVKEKFIQGKNKDGR